MSKLNMVATTVIGTLLLAGSAVAQGSQSTMPQSQSGSPTQLTKPGDTPDAIKTAPPEKMEKMQNGAGTSASGSVDSTAGAAKGAADIKTGNLTTDLVGKPVRNLKGDKIGEVERVSRMLPHRSSVKTAGARPRKRSGAFMWRELGHGWTRRLSARN